MAGPQPVQHHVLLDVLQEVHSVSGRPGSSDQLVAVDANDLTPSTHVRQPRQHSTHGSRRHGPKHSKQASRSLTHSLTHSFAHPATSLPSSLSPFLPSCLSLSPYTAASRVLLVDLVLRILVHDDGAADGCTESKGDSQRERDRKKEAVSGTLIAY